MAKANARPLARSSSHRLVVDGELVLYGAVGDGFGESFTAREVVDALASLAGDLTVRINSGGGSVFDGLAIHEALKSHKGAVTVRVDGIAASAASVVAMAGKKIVVPEASMLMVHRAFALTVGNTEDHAATAGVLAKVDGQLAQIYAKRTGLKRDFVADLMADETWMTGAEAVDLGFADETSDEEPEAFAVFDYRQYRNAPKALAGSRGGRPWSHEPRAINTIRELEFALRDAGFNKHEATRIASGGWRAFSRKPDRLPGSRELASHVRAFTFNMESKLKCLAA